MANQKYHAGDIVKRTKCGGSYGKDYEFEIKRFTSPDGEKKQFAVCKNNSMHSLDCIKMVKPKLRPWEPTYGEKINVCNQFVEGTNEPLFWSERSFLCMDKGRYVCETGDGQYFGYKYAKPTVAQTTITLANGAQVELSVESYNALIDAAINGDLNRAKIDTP